MGEGDQVRGHQGGVGPAAPAGIVVLDVCCCLGGKQVMRPLSIGLLIIAAVGLGSCSQEQTFTEQERVCITNRFPGYNPKQMSQCVDVCKACMKGNVVTCNTACKLRGAS